MWRDLDPRDVDRDRPSPSRGSRAGTPDTSERGLTSDPREALTRDLDLPRGPTRERVRIREHRYDLRGSEVRTLAAAGTFRVVPAADLRGQYREAGTQDRDLSHLRRQGLIRTMPYVVGRTRTTLVTLTERGREALEESRRAHGGEPGQAFYAGISKPRELAHDVRLYRAYEHAADRLATRGARVRRVVLEEELKREYQRYLQASNRGRRDATGRPDRSAEEVERWARERHLPCVDGHVEFPDVRIEYDERDGRRGIEDVEVTTPHYRGAHAAAKARAGFTCYRGVGARVGGGRLGVTSGGRRGGRGFDPRVAEEFLQ
jgi:hypothetical protein